MTILYKCNKCLEEKPSIMFCKDINRKCGISRWCKDCFSIQNKKYKKENKERLDLELKKYRIENKEKIKLKHIEYCKKHKKEIRSKDKEYRIKNKEKRKKWYKDYYNRVEKNNIQIVIRSRLSKKLGTALKYKGLKKTLYTMELLGCDIEFFIKYIEKQFLPGMTWKNYGFYGWHMDHIIPCAWFDLTNIEEQKKCFHYTNIQPMWGADNSSKQDKVKVLTSEGEFWIS